MATARESCINCGRPLVNHRGTMVCLDCNSELLTASEIFIEAPAADGYIVIECPGATLYKEGTNEVEAGGKFRVRRRCQQQR